MSWRGHTLFVEKSALRTRAVVLRDPITLRTLHSHNTRKAAETYCRQNGFSVMEPPKNFDPGALAEPMNANF